MINPYIIVHEDRGTPRNEDDGKYGEDAGQNGYGSGCGDDTGDDSEPEAEEK